MTTHRRWLAHVLVVVVALVGVAAAPAGWADEAGKAIPFGKAKIRIEFNASAEDVGVQVLLDGEPWKRVTAFSPDGRRILDIRSKASLKKQGLTELFFESSEPSLAELPLEKFLARFPAGAYEFKGETIDGVALEGQAILTHVIPAGPSIVAPVSLTDDPPVVDPKGVVIAWEPVTETVTGSRDIAIVGYQVIVEQVEPLRVFSVDLPAAVTSVTVPPVFFLQRGTLHKFEVLAIEASGNQTITEGEFVTAP